MGDWFWSFLTKMYSTFAPLLKQNGMPNHAIVDTGRNAVTGLRAECK